MAEPLRPVAIQFPATAVGLDDRSGVWLCRPCLDSQPDGRSAYLEMAVLAHDYRVSISALADRIAAAGGLDWRGVIELVRTERALALHRPSRYPELLPVFDALRERAHRLSARGLVKLSGEAGERALLRPMLAEVLMANDGGARWWHPTDASAVRDVPSDAVPRSLVPGNWTPRAFASRWFEAVADGRSYDGATDAVYQRCVAGSRSDRRSLPSPEMAERMAEVGGRWAALMARLLASPELDVRTVVAAQVVTVGPARSIWLDAVLMRYPAQRIRPDLWLTEVPALALQWMQAHPHQAVVQAIGPAGSAETRRRSRMLFGQERAHDFHLLKDVRTKPHPRRTEVDDPPERRPRPKRDRTRGSAEPRAACS